MMNDELPMDADIPAFIIHHSTFIILALMAESRDITAEDARTAAQIEADVGVEHIANVYAKALLDTTEKAGQTAVIIEEFDAVVAGVLDRFPKLEAVLASMLVSPEEKSALVDRVLGGRVSAILLNFLQVVARHGRLDCLRAIHCQTHDLYDKLRNRILVRLVTATPLGPAAVEHIAESLRPRLGGEPVFRQETDPDLIGGAVLRIGDTVYDGSIANQLKNLRQQMIQRTAHEIQSRRDRFRYPAGN
jgi:F-type H+-transporting ATPase subunit delta